MPYPDSDSDVVIMKQSMLLPTVYPQKPAELPVNLSSENGVVLSADIMIDDIPFTFYKNAEGIFETDTINEVEKPYLAYVTRLLNRRFGS